MLIHYFVGLFPSCLAHIPSVVTEGSFAEMFLIFFFLFTFILIFVYFFSLIFLKNYNVYIHVKFDHLLHFLQRETVRQLLSLSMFVTNR